MQVLIVNQWSTHGQEPFKAIQKRLGDGVMLQWTVSTLVVQAEIKKLKRFSKLLNRKGIENSFYGEPEPVVKITWSFKALMEWFSKLP